MWIEEIEITGFGNIQQKKIKFAKDKLNLIVESNEFGKSTIAESIWAVLFDYPYKEREKLKAKQLKERERKRPSDGASFMACLDLVNSKRSVRVVRNFSERTVKVFDRNNGYREITDDFRASSNQDEVGLRLLGMERELFKSTCFVGQGNLSINVLSDLNNLCSLLQSIADSSGDAGTSADAISIIEDTMQKYVYNGKKQRLERVIADLEEKNAVLNNQILEMESQKESAESSLDELGNLKNSIAQQEIEIKAKEYFKLCIDLADIDQRLLNNQEKLFEVGNLQLQQQRLSSLSEFPIERQKHVDDLWISRQTRLTDYSRLKTQIDEGDTQLKGKELELKERWGKLSEFSADDAYNIAASAKTLTTLLSELSETEKKKTAEAKAAKASGVEVDKLSILRNALLNLGAKEVDDVYDHIAKIRAYKEQLNLDERSTWRSQMILTEIMEQRKIRAANNQKLVLLLFVAVLMVAIVPVYFLLYKHEGWNYPTVSTSIFIVVGLLMMALFQCISLVFVDRYRKKEVQDANAEIDRGGAEEQGLKTEAGRLQARLDELARKAGVASAEELIKIVDRYAASAAQLKDLDTLEQVALSLNEHILNLRSELERYFALALRQVDEITPLAASNLADDINKYLEASRMLDSSIDLLDHRRSELEFLFGEIEGINAQLQDHFHKSEVEETRDIDKSYQEFCQKVNDYRQLQNVESNLSHLKTSSVNSKVSEDLAATLEKLQAQRNETWQRMDELISRNPEIADISPSPEINLLSMEDKLAQSQEKLRELQGRVDTQCRNYDEHYLETQEELEVLDTELLNLKKTKQALELARDLFMRLSSETHSHWSSKLNEISKEMLKAIGGDFESLHFDKDLNLTVKRKGDSAPLQPAQINTQLSIGTKEQIHWLARMAVSKFLSAEDQLPIILDEPFSEADDDRFIKMMSFLIDYVLPHHQIIVFSCHQIRHQKLAEQLSSAQQNLLEYPSLLSI